MRVRPLRRDEREALLDLLDGWEFPDGARGRDFFRRYVESDPRFDDDDVIVAEDGERLLSCVQIFPRRLRIADAAVFAGGIGSVFTRPELRGTGIASAVLQSALAAMRRREMRVSLLFASRLSFYGRLGWESWLGERWILRATGMPSEASRAARATVEIDDFDEARHFAAVRALHACDSTSRFGTVLRDETAWRASLRLAGNPSEEFLVARHGEEVVAYARAVVLFGFLVVSELGRRADAAGAEALAALVLRLLTPRASDPIAPPGRPSATLRPVAAAPRLHDAALADALRGRGITTSCVPDPSAMLLCLDGPGLARDTGTSPQSGESPNALLRRLLPPERFVFWPADRF